MMKFCFPMGDTAGEDEDTKSSLRRTLANVAAIDASEGQMTGEMYCTYRSPQPLTRAQVKTE